jgi:hypothetical protein
MHYEEVAKRSESRKRREEARQKKEMENCTFKPTIIARRGGKEVKEPVIQRLMSKVRAGQ